MKQKPIEIAGIILEDITWDDSVPDAIFIDFTVEERFYALQLDKSWNPRHVIGETTEKNIRKQLNDHLQEVFEKLIEHPSVRLYMLFPQKKRKKN